MANEGIPLGGQFPSRRVASSAFEDLLGSSAAELGVDRRTLFGKQAERIFSDSLSANDVAQGYQDAGTYLNPQSWSASDVTSATDRYGAETAFQREETQWDVPTSSTNYSRPRTVAAAYSPNSAEPSKGVMTVVFRDGTFYNYYEVSPTEWEAFHASFSKGAPWLNKGFANGKQKVDGLFIGKPRGVANAEDIPAEVREALYRVARTHQQKRPPKPGRTTQQWGGMTIQNQLRANARKKTANPAPRKPSLKGNRKAS